MLKSFIKTSVLVAAMAMLFSSCSKDNDEQDTNPTNGKTSAVFNPNVTYGTMTDQDGNIYKTVTIGTQTWMAENLRTTKYNDGTDIPNITDNDEWIALTTGAYCNYKNTTNVDTIATFGRLYNWYAASTGKLAPAGWHVPSDAEWTQLTAYLGDPSIVGSKLKEKGTLHWNSPNNGATNETGFTALPGGCRDDDGKFYIFGIYGGWWSSIESTTTYSKNRSMDYDVSTFGIGSNNKKVGFSVRCVKD